MWHQYLVYTVGRQQGNWIFPYSWAADQERLQAYENKFLCFFHLIVLMLKVLGIKAADLDKIYTLHNVWRWFNRNLLGVDYISTELTQTKSLPAQATESQSAGCLSQRIPKAATGKRREQLASLWHLTGISIPWVPASVAQRCGSYSGRDPDCTLDAPIPPNAYDPPLMVFTMWGCMLLSTSFSLLFLTHKHCCTQSASANESPLVDNPMCLKTESQHADFAWADVECDMPYFLDCHTSLCWTVTLLLEMQLTPYVTLLMESWDCMTQYLQLAGSRQVSIRPPSYQSSWMMTCLWENRQISITDSYKVGVTLDWYELKLNSLDNLWCRPLIPNYTEIHSLVLDVNMQTDGWK
jgi:hypothetical protein